ncbi:hypothetical protein Mlab_1432 [Methanocorpusculum labreanum Z]|uniref:Glycosyl transferase, family 2 n=1 Tax=Methanocorpusculum labreanum (strain ATCC 43576 / DSM 4855 / Z) TaxID=410358 RepID=A2STE1_METLZ|nr:TIGR00180 family glycosyltransferase [Methanocorpusculum labreanum]ABN07597.1 hypothetical protein Mlab_1432 [Methanocorpusculum labreanum Z]
MSITHHRYPLKNNRQLNQLSLIIPTYNRPFYLSRCLWYLSQSPYNEIIVADSSDEKINIKNKKTINTLQNKYDVNITYLSYPPEIEPYGGDIYRKWADSLKHVNTKYSVFCTDKEFLIPSTLCKCIEYLETHKDCDVAEGNYYYIESPSAGKYRTRAMYPTKCSLLQTDAVARLNAAKTGKNISSNQMALRRSDFHKKLYKTLTDEKINDIRFGEFSLEFLSIIRSKSIYLDLPFRYRDICNLTPSGILQKQESSSLRYPTLDTYISEGIYDYYYARFLNSMSNEIAKNSSYDREQSRTFANEILPQIIRMRGFYGNTKLTEAPLWYLWRHTPTCIKDFAGRIVPKQYLDYSSDFPDEAKPILSLIETTKHLYATDTPVCNGDM